ncbi:MAG: hypothetical protein CMM60_08000 [Rhodospirillaceae bacterium]|nr:hypothetical protein [Rhodospirillaceae bacterium]
MYRTCLSFKALILFICLAVSPGPAMAESGPSDIVGKFQVNLLQVMKEAESLTVRQRFERLAPSVDKSFHMPLMIQIASGGFWKQATPSERTQLVEAFRRMSIATLATLFDGYSGEVFKLEKEMQGPQKTMLVMTKLIKLDKSAVDIAYVLRPFKEGWRIIDVILDNGISELKVRQSECRLILKNKGIPGLISLLNGKADELIFQ